jgi:site-specific DNA-cytosine methylase
MRSLELFSGTGSISKVLRERGWSTITLDLDPKANPDILTDIREWNFTEFPPDYFDFIWASPVCTHYSVARTTAKTPRDLEWADSLVKAALRIIGYFNPSKGWVLENPATGMLKSRPFMRFLPVLTEQDYCQWNSAEHPYQKRTRFWGVLPRELPSRRCNKNCPYADGKRHFKTAQLGPGPPTDTPFPRSQLYSLPPLLCEAFADLLI